MPQKSIVDKFLSNVNVPLEVWAEFLDMMKKEETNAGAKAIYNYTEKGGKCDAWTCLPYVMEGLDKKLSEANIAHAFVRYPSGSDGKNGAIFLITKEEDRAKVESVKDAYIKELNTISKVSLAQLKRDNVEQNIHTIRGVAQTRTAIFQEEAKSAGFIVAVTDNKDGTFDVHYSEKDEHKAKLAWMKTIESTVGMTGRFNEQRVSQEMGANKEIYDSVSNPRKESYIVSAEQPEEYLCLGATGYQYYRNGKLIEDELRSNKNFQQDAHSRIDNSFVRPVVLTPEEFLRVRSLSKEKYKETIEKKRIRTISVTSRDTRHLELERMAHQMAELKMQLENNGLNTDFHNPMQSVSQFTNHEYTTDERLERNMDRDLAENTSNREELPADAQVMLEEYEKLSYEERIYVDEIAKEVIDDVKGVERSVEVEEVTREELEYNDLDAVIERVSGEISGITTREDISERDR